ncbi:MAG: hypothetical protein M9958_00805 [Chitinophagales bacterium]|nr:hypothetical protein [Chitinophagales bacterium]
MNISDKLLFWLIFLGIFIGRLSLLGQGHLDDPDEIPFLELLKQFDKLLQLDADAWNNQVFVMWSTYFETLYRLPQVFVLKWYASWINMPMESTQALASVAFFNLLVVMGISYVFYKILNRLSFDRNLSLLGMLLLASFINSNLYIRHINSYESSFLIHLIALLILLKEKLTWKDYWVAGILSAVAYFDYYGFFMMFLIIWIIGIFRLETKTLKTIALCTVSLSLPAFVLLLFFQGISSLSGHSYIDFTILFSTTIFHGSPEETLKYAYIYLSSVEGMWGYLMFFLCMLGLLYSVFYRKRYSSKAKLFLYSGMTAYLIYGIYAVLTKEMVFYGRVFHMYLPFIVVAVLMIIQRHKVLMIPFFIFAFLNGVFVVKELNDIGYPRSLIYNYGLFENEPDHYQFVYELKPGIEYNYKKYYFEGNDIDVPKLWMPKTQFQPRIKGDLILQNFGFFFHYPDNFTESYTPFKKPTGYKKVLEKKHFMSHPAYTFEYCTKYGRQFFLDKKFEVTIYKKI